MRRRAFMALGALGLGLACVPVRSQAPKPARLGTNQGEILDIDREAREITIRHGYLPELDMDPMTMIFNVADPALLEKVRKGDRVRIKTGLVEGRFSVLALEPVRRPRGQ